ncbi:hypothetical protein CYMTET_56480, partial [Cymbomonas tetramitiformis]
MTWSGVWDLGEQWWPFRNTSDNVLQLFSYLILIILIILQIGQLPSNLVERHETNKMDEVIIDLSIAVLVAYNLGFAAVCYFSSCPHRYVKGRLVAHRLG